MVTGLPSFEHVVYGFFRAFYVRVGGSGLSRWSFFVSSAFRLFMRLWCLGLSGSGGGGGARSFRFRIAIVLSS